MMDLLEVTSADIRAETGADKTLVSRWRSGKRRLMPGHHWARDLALFFLKTDAEYEYNMIPEILGAYYPGKPMDTLEQREELLAAWLTSHGQQKPAYSKERTDLFNNLSSRLRQEQQRAIAPAKVKDTEDGYENTTVYGVKGVQGSTLKAAEIVLKMTEPQDILFICPEGLDMYTRDPKFGPQLMDTLMKLFAAGHRMSAVLRTDFRMSDVSAFSGRWLVAHLLGYIHSYYYDDFHKTYSDKMMAVVGDRMAFKVHDAHEGIVTAIYFDKPSVDKIRAECETYRAKSKQRFYYNLFGQPANYLCGLVPLTDRAHFQFARLPHFCLTAREAFKENFQLSGDEMELIEREFPLFLSHPGMFDADTPVRHIFCEDDIEDALLKSRHMSQELSAITGRRVIMTGQRLAEQLAHIKKLLTENPHYELCFLSDDVFKNITMQIAVWGDIAAIGWVTGGESTACKDYTNVNALTGFCGMVWDQVPAPLRMRRAAIRKINMWLKKARKYGLDV